MRTAVNLIENTAGEAEPERRSRRWNGVEALGLYGAILAVLWPFCYYFGVIRGNAAIEDFAVWPLILGALYILFVSPFVHGDTAATLGLGHPGAFLRFVRAAPPRRRWMLAGVLGAAFLLLNAMNFQHWPDVVKFFGLKRATLGFLGQPETKLAELHTFFPGVIVVVLFGTLLSTAILTCLVRYDNFESAFRTALWIIAPLLALIFAAALAHRGRAAFASLDAAQLAVDAFGYWFWGFTQQLLFSSYFGTRLRKAFGPGSAPPRPGAARSAMVALLFGAGFAAVLAPIGYISVRHLYGAEAAPPALLLWFAAIAFPAGAVYGHFYAREPRRLLVATLGGSIFGIIHVDSYGLVAGTFLLGTILTYVFMEDRNRNLAALGVIHGTLATTFSNLFSKGESGALEVDYSVGPWNVEDPALSVMWFPLACTAAYFALAAWCALRLPGLSPRR